MFVIVPAEHALVLQWEREQAVRQQQGREREEAQRRAATEAHRAALRRDLCRHCCETLWREASMAGPLGSAQGHYSIAPAQRAEVATLCTNSAGQVKGIGQSVAHESFSNLRLCYHMRVRSAESRAQLEAQKAVPSEAMTAEQLRQQHDERWGWRRPQPLTATGGPAHDTVRLAMRHSTTSMRRRPLHYVCFVPSVMKPAAWDRHKSRGNELDPAASVVSTSAREGIVSLNPDLEHESSFDLRMRCICDGFFLLLLLVGCALLSLRSYAGT